MGQKDLANLIRLYYFWGKLSTLIVASYFEVIAAGKGTSCMLGKNIQLDSSPPSRISQIILDP